MRWFAGICVGASLIVMPAIGYAAEAAVDNKADLEKLAAAWMETYNKHDAAGLAKMYTDDALVSGPAWTNSGRAALEDAWKKEMAVPVFSKVNSITVDQSHRVGDMVYAHGAWAADLKGPEGKDVPVDGHWLAVSKCEGTNCLMMIHNFNMAMPPPK
jgi:ketosteroid isomerase-like protein